MSIINLRNVTLGFGGRPLIEKGNLTINHGEHVCLIGRNGVGKSSLLKLIQGQIEAEAGSIERNPGLKIGLLPQEVPHNLNGKVTDIVALGLDTAIHENWEIQHKVAAIISRLDLQADSCIENLSGGFKRRVLLAQTLVNEPDILILDEPTNHLDVPAIIWLEKFLAGFHQTILFVTHDRSFMQKIANHIVEIDNGELISWRGQYQAYLQHRHTELEAQATANALFDKKLAQEEKWIRQGIKARRTRNEGRVRALKKMREQRQQRRTQIGKVKLSKQKVALSGKIVFEVDDISFQYQQCKIVKNFSTLILRGDKIGIIGANGSGKSTFLNLLLGNLTTDSGTITLGTNLTFAYFDQNRQQLDLEKNIVDNVAASGDSVMINGQSKHIYSYLQDFLFSPERARTLVKSLSGGERNRVMLAKLFSTPCNVLVLDEPTNDLDVETLELLEEQLIQFTGTVLLVSHDRTFVNNVVTSTLVMENDGHIGEYNGGYDDWQRQIKSTTTPKNSCSSNKPQKTLAAAKKLNNKQRYELEKIPGQITTLEQQQQKLQTQLSDPDFYKQAPDEAKQLSQQLQAIETQLEQLFERWAELDDLMNSS